MIMLRKQCGYQVNRRKRRDSHRAEIKGFVCFSWSSPDTFSVINYHSHFWGLKLFYDDGFNFKPLQLALREGTNTRYIHPCRFGQPVAIYAPQGDKAFAWILFVMYTKTRIIKRTTWTACLKPSICILCWLPCPLSYMIQRLTGMLCE